MTVWEDAEPGTECDAGFREMSLDDRGGIGHTVTTWKCDQPAVYTVPMICGGCGLRTRVRYCVEHMKDAVRGTLHCIYCPERTADLDGEASPTTN